tara:strand:+ start:52 stop:177 length:126 start_codon:yes stop_codon:yes gene_type:complete
LVSHDEAIYQPSESIGNFDAQDEEFKRSGDEFSETNLFYAS